IDDLIIGADSADPNGKDKAGESYVVFGRDTSSGNASPQVETSLSNQTATTGESFSFQIPSDTFSDPNGDSLTYSASPQNGNSLPEWLSFNANNRTFSGTPKEDDDGTFNLQVTASDPDGASASSNFSLNIQEDFDNISNTISNSKETHPVELQNFKGSLTNSSEDVWVISHGWDSSPDSSEITDLAETLNSQGKQVVLLNWESAADTEGKVELDFEFDPVPSFRCSDIATAINSNADNAAKWINDVANFSVAILTNNWGINSSNINLIGHSLGAYVSSEIGRLIQSKTQSDGVNRLVALDPATSFSAKPGFDINQNKQGFNSPAPFRSVSDYSTAFWGKFRSNDGLGSRLLAQSADDSFEVMFSPDNPDQAPYLPEAIPHYGNIISLYSSLIAGQGIINNQFSLDNSAPQACQKNAFNIDGAYKKMGDLEMKGFLKMSK
ncbi:MAG: hypothetical protein BRC41_11780, partial [Cyanobacteria bacterium QH_9_48_43]